MASIEAAINDQVRAALAEVFDLDPEQVSPDLEFGDLPQWDSMGHMDVMLALEEKFAVEINAETISQLTSIPAMVAHISQNHV